MEDYTGYLRFVLDKKQDKTYIKDSFFQGALKLTRPVYLDASGKASLYIMNPGGGYLDGDRYKIEAELEPYAEALMTTQSSTKIYKTIQTPPIQEINISLKKGSLLEYFPDPTIAFQHAQYKQSTTIFMETGSTLIYADSFTPGWAPDGSLFAYDLIQSKMKIYQNEDLILSDHLKLAPDLDFQGMGQMDGSTHLGTMVVIHEEVGSEILNEIYETIVCSDVDVKFGLSMLTIPGFLLRGLSYSTKELEKLFQICREFILKSWFGKIPVPLRKY